MTAFGFPNEPEEGLPLLVYRIDAAAYRAGGQVALGGEWKCSVSLISAVRGGRRTAPDWMLKRLGLHRTIRSVPTLEG